MRKLATIQRITGLRPIEGADLIEVADVLGWSVVVKKGEFSVGDLCVYFEIDSFLNAADSRYASFEDRFINWKDKRGMRLKTIRLRKQISQGLILSIDTFSELSPSVRGSAVTEGEDVTEVLGIEKWEPKEETQSNAGGQEQRSKSKPFPSFLRKSDQERVQNCLTELKRRGEESFEVSIKLDGSSMTVYHVNCTSPMFNDILEEQEARMLRGMGFFKKALFKAKNFLGFYKKPTVVEGVCSRNIELDVNDDNHFSKFVRDTNMLEAMDNLSSNIAVQGELIAPSIQNNYEKVNDFQFYVYDVYDIDRQEYASPNVARYYADLLGFNYVPVLKYTAKLSDFGDIDNPRELADAILAFAEGPGMNKEVKREGVVFKSNNTQFSFKAISNSYLLKKG